MVQEEVPSINLTKLASCSREQVKFKHALTTTGFFYLTGHGVSKDLLDNIENISADFFGASVSQRKCLSREHFQKSKLIHTGNAFVDKTKNRRYVNALDPNKVDDTCQIYYEELKNLGFELLSHIERVLSLQPGRLSETYCKDPGCFLHCYFYPRGRETPDGNCRIDSHTDKGFITILWQDAVGGLQAQLDGEWVPIPYKKDHFVVNLGDMLEHVTCGIVKATWHRVVYEKHEDRYSWPFFFGLSSDAVLNSLPEFRHNIPNMNMLEMKKPKENQSFNEWFIENVTSAADVVDTSGALWRMTVRDGPADIGDLIGVEF